MQTVGLTGAEGEKRDIQVTLRGSVEILQVAVPRASLDTENSSVQPWRFWLLRLLPWSRSTNESGLGMPLYGCILLAL